jgi:hypothetical protein
MVQSLTIYDILGQVVIVPNAKSGSKIDVSKLLHQVTIL